ncbi:MAG: hypothetical protein WCK77_00695 [Verrucomicrobiota bacterium]
MTAILRQPLLLASCLVVGMLASCASTTKREALSPGRVTVSHHTSQPIQAVVSGGSKMSALQLPGITNEDFQQALESSLVQSGMFTSTGSGGYRLEAFIANIDQPVFGFSMRVNMEVSYLLRRGGTTVWQKSIKSTYEASVGDAFAGPTRVRKATEGAARENIAELIRQLNTRRP